MDLSPTTASPRTPPASANASARERMVSSDFETFLRMLTTQMQNQDPLNPMEATDFAVQLATFSGVEQAVRTNQLLEEMLARSGMSELAGLVGKTVRSPGPAHFDGESLGLSLPALVGVESARLVVRDEMGGLVHSTEVPASGGPFQWRGLGPDGLLLPSGSYRFEVLGYAAGQVVDSGTVETWGAVIEARNDAGSTVLVLSDRREIPLDEVTAIRADGVR